MTRDVLINVPRLDLPGGVANYFLVLRKYLDPGKHYFEIGGKAGESGGLAMIKRALADYWAFHRKLSTGQYSLVHLNPSMVPKSILRDAIFLLIARTHSVPVLAFFHGWNSGLQKLIERRFRTAFAYVYGRTAGLVVLADDYRRQLEYMRVRAPIFRMTTLVDDGVFEDPPRIWSLKRQINILYLSRLDRGKGLFEAIKSYNILKQVMPQVTLTIAGDGVERDAAESLAKGKRLKDVTFLGHVEGDAKSKAFAESDIYLFMSVSEGMPTTVLEAMSYGLPVVTSSVGGLKDFFEHEQMGFIIGDRDPEIFAKMLERLANNPELRRQIGEYNRRYAHEHFAASKIAKKLDNIYTQVLKFNTSF